MFNAAIDSKGVTIASDHPAFRRVMSILQTSDIGEAMMDVLTATDELRRLLEERGDDADTIMQPLEDGWDAMSEAMEARN